MGSINKNWLIVLVIVIIAGILYISAKPMLSPIRLPGGPSCSIGSCHDQCVDASTRVDCECTKGTCSCTDPEEFCGPYSGGGECAIDPETGDATCANLPGWPQEILSCCKCGVSKDDYEWWIGKECPSTCLKISGPEAKMKCGYSTQS